MMFNTVKSAINSIIVLMFGLLLSLTPLHANNINSPEALTLLIKQGQLIKLPQAAKAVFIADPSIASYQAPSSTSLFIFGQAAGTTTLIALDKNEEIIYSRTVQVKHDVDSLSQLIKQQFPLSEVNAVSTANRLILTGSASTPRNADKIVFLAQGYLSSSEADTLNNELINQLSIDLPTQVNIRIRIAEMDRETSRGFGFENTISGSYNINTVGNNKPVSSLNGSNNSFKDNFSLKKLSDSIGDTVMNYQFPDISGTLKAFEKEGLISILAEPNLTSVSGEQAQFLAGGQFPVAQPRDNNQPVTYEYMDYGVKLNMTPTILSPNLINLKVNTSVSEFSKLSTNLNVPPALTIRSTSTAVELASGQSFILAGLLHERENTVIDEIPFLSDIPILGMLFRSESYIRKETELVIIATAYIVEPSRENDFHIPQHGMEPYDHWQRFLYGRILKPSGNNTSSSINSSQPKMIGDYGFIF